MSFFSACGACWLLLVKGVETLANHGASPMLRQQNATACSRRSENATKWRPSAVLGCRAGELSQITTEQTLELLRLSLLFAITALAEFIGCYLPWLVLRQAKPLYLLIPAAASLALFCLASDAPSISSGENLRSLWWYVYCHRVALA